MAQNWTYMMFITIFVNLHPVSSFQYPDGCECPTSKSLQCSNNNMTSIPTNVSLHEITVFNMSSNKIQTLDAQVFFRINLVNVEIIDLSYNSISDIRPNAFYAMNNVKELYLQGNKLTNILPEIFSPLTQLIILDIRNNSIEVFNNKTFESLTHLKNLTILGLRRFNKDISDPLENLIQLKIQFVPTERNPERNNSRQELSSNAKDWGRENNVTIDVPRVEDREERKHHWNIATSHSHDETLISGGFIIGIVITVGVLLLLITSLVILAVIVRQTERMPEELDDYSYMTDFEPYRGHLSPTKCKGFYWPSSRDNISKCMQETSITPKVDLVSNSFPETVKVDLPQNHQDSFKNY